MANDLTVGTKLGFRNDGAAVSGWTETNPGLMQFEKSEILFIHIVFKMCSEDQTVETVGALRSGANHLFRKNLTRRDLDSKVSC